MSNWPSKNQLRCIEGQSRLYESQIDALDPDMIFLIKRGLDRNQRNRLSSSMRAAGDGDPAKIAFEFGGATLELLEADGRNIVLVEAIQEVDGDQRRCLAYAEYVEECSAAPFSGADRLDDVYAQLADTYDNVTVIDLDPLMCPESVVIGRCAALVDAVLVRRDASHISSSYAGLIGEGLVEILDDAGLLDPLDS